MVVLKARKLGNSLCVVLPKEVINRLQTGDGELSFSSKHRKADNNFCRTIRSRAR